MVYTMFSALEFVFAPVAAEIGFGILVKATVILGVAGVTSLLLDRASAATRYAVWGTALAMLLALPLLSVALPSWPLIDAGRDWVASEPAAADPTAQGMAVAPAAAAARTDGVATGGGIAPGSSHAWGIGTLVSVPVVIWLGGVVLMLGRLAVHLCRVDQITRRADGSVPLFSRIAAPLIARLGIHHPVRVLMSDETSMPFSWGLRTPAVVFPSAAREWPQGQIRSVILHELAHVARRDYLVHLIVEVVRALYWINPLVWLAARKCAIERERACDDFALREGTSSHAYASHLLEMARLMVRGYATMGATSMAGEPGLVQRIRCVMNSSVDRSPLRTGRLFVTIALALTIAVPLATCNALVDGVRVPSTTEMINQLLEDDDPLERRRAAWWLGEHESRKAIPALIQALEDDSPDVRLVAAWAHGEIKVRESIDPLVETLNDRDPLVREMVTLSLGEITHPSAIEPLVRVFNENVDLREAAVWALGEIRGDRAKKAREAAFERMGQTPWEHLQVWTGEGFEIEDVKRSKGRIVDIDIKGMSVSRNVPALVRDLEASDPDERRIAAFNLGLLGMMDRYDSSEEIVRVVDRLMDTLRDPVPEVRARAIWSLDEINPSRSEHRSKGRL